MSDTARDPYAGLLRVIRDEARGQNPKGLCIGTVISPEPDLKIRADGHDLDREDLRLPWRLTQRGQTVLLSGLEWPLTADLPETIFYGTCIIHSAAGDLIGEAQVTRPAEVVEGETAAEAAATFPPPLAAGDEVLLEPSEDGQIYYVIDRMVSL